MGGEKKCVWEDGSGKGVGDGHREKVELDNQIRPSRACLINHSRKILVSERKKSENVQRGKGERGSEGLSFTYSFIIIFTGTCDTRNKIIYILWYNDVMKKVTFLTSVAFLHPV